MALLRLNNIMKDINRIYKHLGCRKLLKKAICDRYDLIIFEGKTNEDMHWAHRTVLEIQAVGKQELYLLDEYYRESSVFQSNPMGWFKDNIDNDYTCLIARCKGTIIGYIWWCDFNVSSKFHDLDVKIIRDKIELKDDDVYCSDFFISPEYRRGGYANEFACKIKSALNKLGYNRILFVVSDYIRPLRRFYRLLRFHEIKSIAARRLFIFIVVTDRTLFFDKNGWQELCRVDDFSKA